ncbi:MAG: dTDP-4-dehydrorhamnose reductase [Candidatus Calescibacterium sp.]|nr:dTDP-4-dehydrorhamnose reductase [Candidatus Calescibacterium sp.]MCX7734007.1 dTDP-4-dehydrorhamnose reductase [bacterium]MDW8086394.1 dTDP-4-dehydrorhamnose reductase [Candidatus Calescibacterium sp.]
MKVIVFGYGGQLGTDIVRCIEGKANYKIFAFRHQDLDINDFEKVKEVILSIKPDIVFNCSAWNKVDDAEFPENSNLVFRTNAFAPSNMARVSSRIKSIFVNISTDYVFDGRKMMPYEETDDVNPLSVYALSKLLGELLVKKHSERYIIVRSGGLYGISGSFVSQRTYRNFVERVIENVSAGKKMKIVNDVFSAPTYTFDLARKICEIVEDGFLGIIHIMQNGVISWFDFSIQICKMMRFDESYIEPVTYDQLNPIAKRPKFSVLKNSILDKLGKNDLMDIQEALEKYLKERSRYI